MVQIGTFAPQGWRLELRGVDGAAAQWARTKGVALELERLGYDSLWLYDHFHTVPRPEIQPTFECWTTMAALAEATSRIRLGQLVTCALYRNPGYFATIRSRLDRMADTARILKAMWTEERASAQGKYFAVKDAVNEPKPLQRPHPPLWIGAQGERVALRMVAELADGWNHNRGPGIFEQKLEILHRHCRDVGRDPRTLRISVERTCAIFDDDRERQAFIRGYWPTNKPERINAFLDDSCVGTTEKVIDELRFFIDRGAELIILWFQDLADVGSGTSQAERFMGRVAPVLRRS